MRHDALPPDFAGVDEADFRRRFLPDGPAGVNRVEYTPDEDTCGVSLVAYESSCCSAHGGGDWFGVVFDIPARRILLAQTERWDLPKNTNRSETRTRLYWAERALNLPALCQYLIDSGFFDGPDGYIHAPPSSPRVLDVYLDLNETFVARRGEQKKVVTTEGAMPPALRALELFLLHVLDTNSWRAEKGEARGLLRYREDLEPRRYGPPRR